MPGIDTSTPYLIYYGNWTPTQIETARTDYAMVILHPVSNITAADIAVIQRGADNIVDTADDVLVLAYISVGEDDRPGAPVTGDGTGPRVDPRADDTEPLAGIAPLGVASPNGTGFASYYLDDTDPDGQPDTNTIFGGAFVNAGDPAWYQVVRNNEKDVDGVSGLEEILTDSVGNALACDGVFLDTLDTPAPNSFGSTLFEWTAPGYQTLLAQISADYPDKIILGNRGIFFYNPNLKQYEFNIRPYLNLILFESYYTDSSDANVSSPFFDDNKFNWAPKLNAEAGREDGFTILCLGYDHPATIPQSVKDQDYVESMREQGWPLYRTNGALNTAFNLDAMTWLAANPDGDEPTWDSTAATSADSDPGTAGNQAPAPRVGVQEAIALDGAVTLRWDVARDQTGPVRYNIYVTDAATLDFATATKLSDVATDIPAAYKSGAGTGAGVYAYEATVSGLVNATTYQFAVRAEDGAVPSNEEANTVTLAATPQPAGNFATIAIDGGFTDWDGIAPMFIDQDEGTAVDFVEVWAANDADFLYLRFNLEMPAAAFSDFNTHLFVDADNNSATGFVPGGSIFGSELMVELGIGYDQRGGGFNEGVTGSTGWAISPTGVAPEFELRVALNTLYADGTAVFPGSTLRLMLQDNRGEEITGANGFEYQLATPPPAPAPVFANIVVDGDLSDWDGIPSRLSLPSSGDTIDFQDVYVANDSAYLYGRFTLHAPASPFTDFNTHVFIDTDGNGASGFVPGASLFGSEVMVESGAAFDQRNGGFNEGSVSALDWSFAPAGSAQDFEFRISRAALYADDSPVFGALADGLRLLLQDNRGDSLAGDSGVEFGFAAPDTPFGIWQAANFTAAELLDPTISGELGDPDGDGSGNLLEFALGMQPQVADPENLPKFVIVADGGQSYPGLSYERVKGSGLTFAIERSGDLETWTDDVADVTEVSVTDLGNGSERVEVRLNTAIPGNERAFLRLWVSL